MGGGPCAVLMLGLVLGMSGWDDGYRSGFRGQGGG